jgi:plastocyanin
VRRIGVVLALVLLVAAACSDDKSTTTTSGPTTVKVSVDNKTTFPASFLEYFPNQLKVHAGDTLSFSSVFTGEPHSVSFGTLVTEGLTAADSHKDDPSFDSSTIPQLAAIPPMLPDGPGDANQVSAAPCYVATGNPPGPGETPCPNHAATPPEFTGSESFFSSGFLPNGETYNVKLASSIKPGTYRFFCTLHTEGMQGAITVVGSGDTIPTEAENQTAADAALQKDVSALQPAVDATKNATPDKAVGGAGSEEVQSASANVFGPPTATVPVGGSVNWTLIGPHTISFNAPEDAKVAIARAPDGLVHLNEKAFTPTGGGVPQPQPPQPTEGATTTTAAATTTTGGAPPPPTQIDGGSFNGSGFYNTGIYLSVPPDSLFSYKLKFTKAGTYPYVCLIHPGMEGTVKVG